MPTSDTSNQSPVGESPYFTPPFVLLRVKGDRFDETVTKLNEALLEWSRKCHAEGRVMKPIGSPLMAMDDNFCKMAIILWDQDKNAGYLK